MQPLAIVVSLVITVVAVALFAKAIARMVAVIKTGQPAVGRSDHKAARWFTMLKETLAHTRMLQWTAVGVGHWFVFVGFGLLFATLVNAYGQLFDPHFILPVIGHFFLFEWITEFFAWAMLAAIVVFIGYRLTRPGDRVRGTRGRFFGSTMWQGYFVEAVILTVGICILLLRFFEYANAQYTEHADQATTFHFPTTAWAGEFFVDLSDSSLSNLIWLVAMLKIVISMIWMIVQLGFVFRANSGMQQALGEGARYATLCVNPNANLGCGQPTPAQVKARMEAAVDGNEMGTFAADTAKAGVLEGAQFYDLTVRFSMPTSLLIYPGPTINLSKSKRVWVAS